MSSSINIEQIEMFTKSFKDLEEVQVRVAIELTLSVEWMDGFIGMPLVKRPGFYQVRLKGGRFISAHWTDIRSIER